MARTEMAGAGTNKSKLTQKDKNIVCLKERKTKTKNNGKKQKKTTNSDKTRKA